MKKKSFLIILAATAVLAVTINKASSRANSLNALRAKAGGICIQMVNQTCPQLGEPSINSHYYGYEYRP
jgi:hypothetical protein